MSAGETHAPDRTADQALVARLRAGDEAAFAELVAALHRTMLAVAETHVTGRAVAEEVVQETWLGVLQGLDRFEARSSLKTWVLAILVNKAKSRGVREARSVPFAALAPEPAVDPGRFRPAGEAWAGHWRAFPADWTAPSAEAKVRERETLRATMAAIAALPAVQGAVIRMRDVEGYSAEEVCAALDLTGGNQRVLLHRARSRVRAALEAHVGCNG